MNVKNLAMTWLVAVPLILQTLCALGGAEPEFYGYLDFGGSNADSGSYFKTGYVPDLAKTKIVMRYALTDNDAQSSGLLAANGYTAGSTVVGQGLAASFLFSKNKTRDLSIGYTYGTTEVNNAATFGELAGYHTLVSDGPSMTYDGVVTTAGDGARLTGKASGPLVVGAMLWKPEYNNLAKMRLQYLRIYEDGELVCDYIPAKVGASVGLYDRVGATLLAPTTVNATPTVGGTFVEPEEPGAPHEPGQVTWSGAGADANWSTAGNWAEGYAPTAADWTVFPYVEGKAEPWDVVLDADATVVDFFVGGATTFSGGHALAANVIGGKGHADENYRLAAKSLTVTGAGTVLKVTANAKAQLSGDLMLKAADGAALSVEKLNFSDNGNITLWADGADSALAFTMNANTTFTSGSQNTGISFKATAGGTLSQTDGYALTFGSGSKATLTADGGTLDMTKASVNCGDLTLNVASNGVVKLSAVNLTGGAVNLTPDATWNATDAHITTTGNLTLGVVVAYTVDVSGWKGGTATLAVAKAGGTLAFTAPTAGVTLTGAGAAAYTASLVQEGKFLYLTVIDHSGAPTLTALATCTATVTSPVYTGGTLSPQLTVTDPAAGGKALVEGTDYTRSGDTAKTAVGSYVLTLTGKGNYTGTKAVAWQIVSADPDDDVEPMEPPLVDNTLRFLDTTQLMNFVATKDYTVDGMVFGSNTRTKISGGHAVTLNSTGDKLLDPYTRLFLGNCELTVSGSGTAVTIKPQNRLTQSSGLKLTVERGAKYTNNRWQFGDNDDYYFTVRGADSQILLTPLGYTDPANGYGFEAYDGGVLRVAFSSTELKFGCLDNVYVADGGTLDLPAVLVTGGSPALTVAGAGRVNLRGFAADGGTVTLRPDATWDASTPRLTVTGAATFGANVKYAVDLSALGSVAQNQRLAFAKADGGLTFNASRFAVGVTGGEGHSAGFKAEGDTLYLVFDSDEDDGSVRWRWTSNARADAPDWHEVAGAALYAPPFTSEWAQDNVLELLGDCRVAEQVVFSGRLTLRSAPGCGQRSVRFVSPSARLVSDGSVFASNVVFRGNIVWDEPALSLSGRFGLEPAADVSDDYAHGAWRVNPGCFLTLGAGTVVRDFLTRYADGGGAVCNAGGVLTVLPGAAVCDNRGNCGAVVNEGEGSVVRVEGGEFARNYVAGLANPRMASGSALMAWGDGGTLVVRGGEFHDNFTRSDTHGGAIGLNARAGTRGVRLSGAAVVRDNYNVTLAADGTVAASTLMNLYVRDAGKLVMDGDLAAGASVGVYRGAADGDDEAEDAVPRLKFGVCSDLHLNVSYRGASYLKRALAWWKREGVDAIVIAGDLADCGDVASCKLVSAAIAEVYGDDWPELAVIWGNHDNLGGLNATTRPQLLRDEFRMGEQDDNAFIRQIKGYWFVGRHWTRNTNFRIDQFLAAHAAELKGDKPFFYIQHPHPNGTCHSPYGGGQESESDTVYAATALRDYPNAIAFSGHSHYQLCDEHTVWKGSFISIGTGSMANQTTPPGRENSTAGCANPVMKAAEAVGYCAELVTLYDHELKVERHEFQTSEEGEMIGDDWHVPLGEAGEWTFERRAAASLPPAFARDAEVSVRSYTGTLRDASSGNHEIWEVSFPTAAAHDGRPRAIEYEVAAVVNLYDYEWRAVKRVLSPHYGRAARLDDTASCLFAVDTELPASGQSVRFEVRPVSSFGKAGEPIISVDFKR